MPDTITKADMARAIDALPEDATVEDAIERLLMITHIREGIGQARRGETTPHEDVFREIRARIQEIASDG